MADDAIGVNAAATDRACDMGTMQVVVPEHAPDQPSNLNPDPGWADRVTLAVEGKFAAHAPVAQLMPAGLLVTEPVPATETESANCEAVGWPAEVAANVAATVLAASRVTLHVPEPLQAPDQPAKVNPGFGVALSETTVPAASEAVQTFPQLMLPGALVTVPPCDAVTASGYVVAPELPETGSGADADVVGELAGSRHPASAAEIAIAAKI